MCIFQHIADNTVHIFQKSLELRRRFAALLIMTSLASFGKMIVLSLLHIKTYEKLVISFADEVSFKNPTKSFAIFP